MVLQPDDFSLVWEDEFNCNVNGTEGFPLNGWTGDALTFDSEAPTDFVIDYVRVYQYNSLLD